MKDKSLSKKLEGHPYSMRVVKEAVLKLKKEFVDWFTEEEWNGYQKKLVEIFGEELCK